MPAITVTAVIIPTIFMTVPECTKSNPYSYEVHEMERKTERLLEKAEANCPNAMNESWF